MVEQNRSGVYTQIVYAPGGQKFALMNGQTLQKAFAPLPGGGQTVYNSSGLLYYAHTDHLGSTRFASTPSRTMYFDMAYAPFGETYAASGSTDASFTTQRQDTVAGLYDFPAREYSIQGRWPSPDPAGLASVDPTNPQSWNRYAYVFNNPLTFIDPLGLMVCMTDPEGNITSCYDSTTVTADPLGFGFDGGGVPRHQPLIDGPPDTFFHKLGGRLACAAQFGDAHSLASATGTQDSFLGKAFLGNTFSGLTQLGLLAAGGPSEATFADAGIAALSGTHQGLPGGGNIGKGPLGVAQDAVIGPVAAATYNTVIGAGTQTLELGISGSRVATSIAGVTAETAAATVALAKLGLDFATFGYGLVKCK